MYTELSATGVGILLEQFVDDTVELHETSILAKIVFWFDQEGISNAVASSNGNLSWFLHRIHDIHFILDC
jgi:hypothetical protein